MQITQLRSVDRNYRDIYAKISAPYSLNTFPVVISGITLVFPLQGRGITIYISNIAKSLSIYKNGQIQTLHIQLRALLSFIA